MAFSFKKLISKAVSLFRRPPKDAPTARPSVQPTAKVQATPKPPQFDTRKIAPKPLVLKNPLVPPKAPENKKAAKAEKLADKVETPVPAEPVDTTPLLPIAAFAAHRNSRQRRRRAAFTNAVYDRSGTPVYTRAEHLIKERAL